MSTLADELLARARAALAAGISDPGQVAPVFDAHVPDNPPTRYVVIYPEPGSRWHEDLAHTSDVYRFGWQVTAVGATRPEAEWLATRLRDAFVDARPVVDGLEFEAIEHTGSQPIRPDQTVPGRLVLFGTDQYAVTATATR